MLCLFYTILGLFLQFNFFHWNILQLQSKYAVFIFRQQHDWQPKGEQKKTGGQSWQGLPPNISSSTWTSPSYGQPMVNSQSNMTTQSTMINSQQPPVNIDPLLSCSMLSPHPHLLPPLLTRWSAGSMVSLPGLCGLSRCAALMLKSWKHRHIGIARAGILLPQIFFYSQ